MKYMIQGFLLGLAYVAPIGTQNIFVINTALSQSRRRVFFMSAIVAFFDVALSVACFYGMGAIMSSSVWLELALIFVGSIVVIIMGTKILKSSDNTELNADVEIPITKVIATSCIVTWFNPQAIIDGSMLLGASKAAIPAEYGMAFIISCAAASVCWWFVMPSVVYYFKSKFSDKAIRIISVVCGIFIVVYGCKLFVSGIQLVKSTWLI
ncbi:MAG: amino acid transporter [Clostridiales bacterium]|nr:amino acid transporter [Clostridiales bacterium]